MTLDGRLLGARPGRLRARRRARPGWAEQDPGAWWSAVVSAVRALHAADLGEIVAIGVDGHGPTLVAGRRPRRGDPAGDHLPRHARDRRGGRAGGRDRRPRLGARRAAGRALGGAPRAGRRRRDPLVPLDLGVAGVPADRRRRRAARPRPGSSRTRRAVAATGRAAATGCHRPARPATVVGELTATAADALGLRAGIPVVGGTVDAFASYLGAGLLEPGDAYDPGGSAGGFGVYWDRAGRGRRARSSRRRRWPACTASGRRWRRPAGRSTGTATASSAATITTEALLAEAAATPPGADGLVFLPYLAGERSPIWDPAARGVFAGLTLGHGRGHLARAIVEASRAGHPPRRDADARGRRHA